MNPQLVNSTRDALGRNVDNVDIESFLDTIRSNADGSDGEFFTPDEPIYISRAPGRLDLMGGIADYSGSLVLQWPIKEATWVALQRTDEKSITIVGLGAEKNGRDSKYSIPLSSLSSDGMPLDYVSVQKLLALAPRKAWVAYVLGVFLVLMHERQVKFESGARILISSDIPEGKGVASSAALEVATMSAVASAFKVPLIPSEVGLLCQIVENRVVGAPCGVMDQMASACGVANSFMALLCQPADLLGNVALPDGLSIWGLDSGHRHSVTGSDYSSVRTATFMGLAIVERIVKRRLGHYLARISPSEFAQIASKIPETLTGREFLVDFGTAGDPLSVIDEKRTYPVRAAAAHPIYEHFRVSTFSELIKQGQNLTERGRVLLGELMYQSHVSYSDCGLGYAATDRLVELARQAGPEQGIYGAKITGGGSGGTVAILGRSDAQQAINSIVEKYESETSYRPYVFSGSSDGASKFGVVRTSLRAICGEPVFS